MTSLPGIDLEQYRTQAKDLLKQIRLAAPEALERLQKNHPEYAPIVSANQVRLADAQLILARENGFPSWAKFKEYLLFRNAVAALDAGDLPALESLLERHPALVRYRCRIGPWYEEGYFAGATLLNHIAGNPIRCPLPANILDVTRLLLRHGARDLSPQPGYTIGLLLTSKQASEVEVALPLIDLLMEAVKGQFDLKSPDLLTAPLGNQASGTAEALIRRGAGVRLDHAAALGRLDLVRCLVLEGEDLQAEEKLIPLPADHQEAKALKEQAYIDACLCGQTEVAEFLLDLGVDPSAQGRSGQTGLHYAAHSGHLETVRRLLARKVPLEEKNIYGGTVLGQTLWSAYNEPQPDHLAIIKALIAAGAEVAPAWHKQIEELRWRQN